MAKSAYRIRMDYQKAIKEADKLKVLASDLKQTADRLDQSLTNVKSAWKSDSSVKYVNKGRKLREELKKRAKELDQAAGVIRQIAQNTYKAEMEALRLAKERSYSG